MMEPLLLLTDLNILKKFNILNSTSLTVKNGNKVLQHLVQTEQLLLGIHKVMLISYYQVGLHKVGLN